MDEGCRKAVCGLYCCASEVRPAVFESRLGFVRIWRADWRAEEEEEAATAVVVVVVVPLGPDVEAMVSDVYSNV